MYLKRDENNKVYPTKIGEDFLNRTDLHFDVLTQFFKELNWEWTEKNNILSPKYPYEYNTWDMFIFDKSETEILIWIRHLGKGEYEFAIQNQPSYAKFKDYLSESKKNGWINQFHMCKPPYLMDKQLLDSVPIMRFFVEDLNELLDGLILMYRFIWENEVHNKKL